MKIHDFRKGRWGWSCLTWKVSEDHKSVSVTGIGKGISKGDYLIIRGLNDVYKVEDVKYETNPADMFTVVLSGVYTIEDYEEDQVNQEQKD